MCKNEAFEASKQESTPMNEQSIEKLTKDKTPIICKDGMAKIDSNHPDYKFWMED